jgi:hypothetical protein
MYKVVVCNFAFLPHLSWKFKWAFLIACCPASVCLSICKLLHFWVLLQNHYTNFNQTWHKSSLGEGDSSVFKGRDGPSPRGDNSKRVKIHWKFLKIFSSRTSRPKSIKLDKNYPWVKGIQVCTNKGPGPLERGDNHKNVKMGWGHLKIFSRTTGPILTRFGTNHPWG